MRMVVGVAVGLCVDAVVAMRAVVTMGAVAMAVTVHWSRVVCMVEDVFREGSRDWRESVARALTKMALECRLHRRSYGRLRTGE
jgi:hypothetical protein